MTSRRQFLKYIPCTFIVTKYNAVLADNKNVINYKITAKKTSFSFRDNTSAELLLYNDTNPGPTLKGNVGDILRVNFTNKLDEPTSIHWHGIKNINKMDGVPYLTQDPIQPGESFVYEFPLNHSGTYWYHAHMDSWKQVAKGLYGPLVISNSKENIFDDDLVILADDWRLNKNYEIDEKSFGSLMDWSHAGRIGNWLTINGKKSPEYQINKNGLTRLRFINASNARVLKFGSSLKKMEIIAVDGMSVKPFFQEVFTLAPGQRLDISVNLNELSEVNFFEISQKKPLNAFVLKTIKSNQITNNKRPNFSSKYSLPSLENAKIIKIHMQGGAMGNLAKAEFEGVEKDFRTLATEDRKLWAFNKEIGSYNNLLGKVKTNEVVVFDLWNDTRWPHSMHLHGNHFFVKSKEFKGLDDYLLRDTYLMQPGEKSKFIVLADNPGKWLFHCHMLEHAASGMVGYLEVI